MTQKEKVEQFFKSLAIFYDVKITGRWQKDLEAKLGPNASWLNAKRITQWIYRGSIPKYAVQQISNLEIPGDLKKQSQLLMQSKYVLHELEDANHVASPETEYKVPPSEKQRVINSLKTIFEHRDEFFIKAILVMLYRRLFEQVVIEMDREVVTIQDHPGGSMGGIAVIDLDPFPKQDF